VILRDISRYEIPITLMHVPVISKRLQRIPKKKKSSTWWVTRRQNEGIAGR